MSKYSHGQWVIVNGEHGFALGRERPGRRGRQPLHQILFVHAPGGKTPYLQRWVPGEHVELAEPSEDWERYNHPLTGEPMEHPQGWREFYALDQYKRHWLY